MRNINWTSVQASTDGAFEKLPAGPYVVSIVSMEDYPMREYVELVYDIAEGEHRGYYSDDWGKSHPYAHHIFLSYKDRALGMLKGRLEAIQKSNPGFDPFAAWDAGNLALFNGKLLGVNLQEEEYKRNDGDIATRLNVCQVVPADKVRAGEVKARDVKRLEGATAQPAQTASVPGVFDGHIPFN